MSQLQNNLFAQIKANKKNNNNTDVDDNDGITSNKNSGGFRNTNHTNEETTNDVPSKNTKNNNNNNAFLTQMLAANQNKKKSVQLDAEEGKNNKVPLNEKLVKTKTTKNYEFTDQSFLYDKTIDSFIFAAQQPGNTTSTTTTTNYKEYWTTPCYIADQYGNKETNICIPLAPCIYRMTDYTYIKKEPILLHKCILKLGIIRCLQYECNTINSLLWNRYHINNNTTVVAKAIEEDELGKLRFMELLSNCGIYQKVSELIIKQIVQCVNNIVTAKHAKHAKQNDNDDTDDTTNQNPYRVPQIIVDGLNEFIQLIEQLVPTLYESRQEIQLTQQVNYYPGLGELYTPGSKVICYPDGMEGTPLGCSVVQCWYDEEINKATNKLKRKFVLIIEFIVSVGDELVFVAASDVYPEFHDINRSIPIKDLKHRKLVSMENNNNNNENTNSSNDDAVLLERLQLRGEFYASVAIKNHYLEYHPNSFYPIIGGGWSTNAVRPLSKGGRVMVDVKRGIIEGHMPVRVGGGSLSADGMSDTVKEAIKLFEQSKRTGVAVPFRTCILPGFDGFQFGNPNNDNSNNNEQGNSDRHHLWQAWPMLTGFSFTARVWGKLLLGMPKITKTTTKTLSESASGPMISRGELGQSIDVVRRPSMRKFGGAVIVGALGGVGKCGNCNYIKFHEQAFEQLVLADDKKELIRAVARNAGGGNFDHDNDDDNASDDDDDDDDDDDIGIDVVANKGGASIFLLQGPPGTGKTLTAEAIAELLRKPLYVVTAGDLGITASEVEKTLGSVLELCQTWDALVLIDEADIFLEARNSHEIQRNALVCVMLRLLEYYSGCLFLSSNRSASSIDAAIASRITVMLSYPQLDVEGRAKVWRNLIGLIPSKPDNVAENTSKAAKYRMEFTDDDYHNLALGYNLNGRQIKNSIVLARALARERNMPLSMPVIRRAVTAVAGEDSIMEVAKEGSVPY